MSVSSDIASRFIQLVNRSHRLNGRPFDEGTKLLPPGGPFRSWVHYGVMIPDLPAPHHYFNVMSIVGTPGATVFDNDFALAGEPRDTAYLISSTASMTPGQFRSYSISRDCEFREDGSFQKFGSNLEIEGEFPNWKVRRFSDGVEVILNIEATSTVSHFAHIPKLYDHWSLLCRYTGTVQHSGVSDEVQGLCTFEYACGVGRYSIGSGRTPARGKLPLNFFTYQIINVNERKQLLLVQVLGPGNFPLQQTVYVRSLDDLGRTYNRAVKLTVETYQPETETTPDGFEMKVPRRFAWYAETDDGKPVLSLSCEVAGPFEFGLGAGYASWFNYKGTLEGESIQGKGYLEYIDRR